MSIKKKVVISNILSFLIPVFISIVALFISFNAVEERFDDSYYYKYSEIIQKIVRSIDEENYEKAIENVKEIEKDGYLVSLVLNDNIEYESDNYSIYSTKVMQNYFENKIIETDMGNYTVIGDVGEFNFINLGSEKENSYLSIFKIESRPTIEERNKEDVDYIMKVILFVLLAAIIAIILTTSIVTFIILNSILKPLELLQSGTNQIREGNLNFAINYTRDDELGAVFGDFENMRKQLLNSREEEKRYQENRKELIAGITHDLNTPLTSIKGYTAGLLDGIADTREKQTNYLKKINGAANQMSELINELLLYSTLDMDNVSFNFIKTDLVEYFKDCILEIESQYKSKNMNLLFTTDLSTGKAYANIDWIHFKRVVLNILNNSIKYKKAGEGNVHINLSEEDENYIIKFSDDGIGVPKDEIANIFEVFFRLDKSRNKKTGGSGLGLAIVKNIVTAHSGNIRVNENYTNGLELILTLPKA